MEGIASCVQIPVVIKAVANYDFRVRGVLKKSLKSSVKKEIAPAFILSKKKDYIPKYVVKDRG